MRENGVAFCSQGCILKRAMIICWRRRRKAGEGGLVTRKPGKGSGVGEAELADRAGAGRPVQQGALGALGLDARGLHRIDRRSDRRQRRGAHHRYRAAARRRPPHRQQDDRPPEARGAGDGAALSRNISDRGGGRDGEKRAPAPPAGRRSAWWRSARRARRRRPTPRASSTMSPPRRCAPSRRFCANAGIASPAPRDQRPVSLRRRAATVAAQTKHAAFISASSLCARPCAALRYFLDRMITHELPRSAKWRYRNSSDNACRRIRLATSSIFDDVR